MAKVSSHLLIFCNWELHFVLTGDICSLRLANGEEVLNHFAELAQYSGSFNKRRPHPSCSNNNNNKFKHVSFAINKIWFSCRVPIIIGLTPSQQTRNQD
jgi:hypothetical protein